MVRNNKKTIGVILAIVLFVLSGCSSTKPEPKYYYLPYDCDEFNNIAYKSVTLDDYIIKEDC